MEIFVPDGPGPIAVHGFARPRPERAADLERLLLSFVEPTRAKPGSLVYEVHRDAADPSTIVFYELWRSADDLRAHLEHPDLVRFQRTRMEYLREDLELHWLHPLSADTR